jgi:predicted methyltransferase
MTNIGLMAMLCALACVPGTAAAGGSLAEALASPDRPGDDQARDPGRKPAEVIEFLGIGPGMTAIDLIAAGGYYTEVLSAAVGPAGKVYAQNGEYVLKLRDGANDKAISARLAGGRLANVERLDREMSDLGLAPASVDAAVTALNFHDIYNARGEQAAGDFLAAAYRLLKPGGVLGLIDHAGNPDEDNKELHRIEEARVEAAVKAAGFLIEASSDLLRNPDDDRSQGVFAAGLRGNTDRFLMRLRKPQ